MTEVDLAECSLDVKGGFMRLRSHDGGRIFDRQKKFDRTLHIHRGAMKYFLSVLAEF